MYINVRYEEERYVDLEIGDVRDIYLISTYGNIKNKNTGLILKPCKSEKGYMMVCLYCNNGLGKTYKIHKLVAHTFLEYNNIIKNPTVNHKNGDKTDNSIFNLEIISFSDNIRHGFKHGLIKPNIGMNSGSCKFHDDIIIDICKLLNKNNKPKSIIKYIYDKYNTNIKPEYIYDIKHKRTRRHISDIYLNIE